MSKTLKQEAEEWAKDYMSYDCEWSALERESHEESAVEGYVAGHEAALASIEPDEGDLHGCCADYAELESDGGGTQGLTLKDMLFEAYYEGVKLAVERIKEGKWVKR